MQHDSKKESCFFMKGNKASATTFKDECRADMHVCMVES